MENREAKPLGEKAEAAERRHLQRPPYRHQAFHQKRGWKRGWQLQQEWVLTVAAVGPLSIWRGQAPLA